MAEIISCIYKITNTVTKDFYIGSSKDVKRRWKEHKRHSTWKRRPNSPMYHDMQKYGTDSFDFQILEEVEEPALKKAEQKLIEILKPTYNSNRAYTGCGTWNGREAEYNKERYQKYKEEILEQAKQYYESNKEQKKQHQKQYYESNKEQKKQHQKQYDNQLCFYNGQTITLCALKTRFMRQGISNPAKEAKKYLVL